MRSLLLLLFCLPGLLPLCAQPVFYNEAVPSSALRKEKNKDITVFYVYQEDCGHCHDFQAKLNNDKDLSKWLRKKATLISRNAALPENREFLQKYQLTTTPSIVWYKHSSNQSYVYENADDVTALYLSLLRTDVSKKLLKVYRKRLSADPLISDELSGTVFTYLDLAGTYGEQQAFHKRYSKLRIKAQEVSPLLLKSCQQLQCTLDDTLGQYLFDKHQALYELAGEEDFYHTCSALYNRSIQKAYETKDEQLFTRSIELEYILRPRNHDSLFAFRRLEFYSGTRMHEPYVKTAEYVRDIYRQNAPVLYALSQEWFNAFPQDIAEVNALAARCVYLENTGEHRKWYARILRERGYEEEARLLENMP
ncbi:MAG: thioredoxin family protein [Flavobacteriales bacterium]